MSQFGLFLFLQIKKIYGTLVKFSETFDSYFINSLKKFSGIKILF